MTARLLLMILAGWTVVLLALVLGMTRLFAWAQDDDAPQESRQARDGEARAAVRIPEPRSGARDVAARSESAAPPPA